MLWAALLVGATVASAAPPYYPSAVNDLKDARVYRTIYVDSSGRCSTKHRCDFRTLSDAFSWVTAQTPAAASRWVVKVYSGNTDASGHGYSETSLTVPNFTLVECLNSPGEMALLNAGQCMVKITGTSGAGVTLGTGSNLADMGFNYTGVLEAGYKAISCPTGCVATMARSMVFVAAGAPDVAFDLVSVTGGSLTAESVAMQRGGSGKVNARLLHASSGSAIFWGSYFLNSSSQAVGVETSGTGIIRVVGGRSAGGAVLDFKNTAGTLSIDSHAYGTESGTITRAGALSPRVTYGNTAPAACTPPELFVDVDSSTLCACTTANTWKCAAIS